MLDNRFEGILTKLDERLKSELDKQQADLNYQKGFWAGVEFVRDLIIREGER